MDEKFIELVKNYSVNEVEITESSGLFGDLGISSLGMFSLVCDLEAAYGVKINIIELIEVKTVGQLYKKFVR